jgi:hypothetical protein
MSTAATCTSTRYQHVQMALMMELAQHGSEGCSAARGDAVVHQKPDHVAVKPNFPREHEREPFLNWRAVTGQRAAPPRLTLTGQQDQHVFIPHSEGEGVATLALAHAAVKHSSLPANIVMTATKLRGARNAQTCTK